VAEILVFSGLAAIFAELEFAGLLNRQSFAALRSSVAAEWDRKASVQIRKTYRSFRRRRSAVAKKNEVKIE
jgi:hypothetical protein